MRSTSARRPLLPVLLAAALAGCAAPPAGTAPGWVELPPQAVVGAGDPTRGAILSSAFVFGQPASVAGDPAAAATALGQLEYLAVELVGGPQWRGGFDPLVAPMMQMGRDEARRAFGVRPTVSAQGAVDAFYGAAAALRAGDRGGAQAALATVSENPEATLQRLAALPYLPQAAAATSAAQRALTRRDRDDRPLFRL